MVKYKVLQVPIGRLEEALNGCPEATIGDVDLEFQVHGPNLALVVLRYRTEEPVSVPIESAPESHPEEAPDPPRSAPPPVKRVGTGPGDIVGTAPLRRRRR